MDMIFLREKHKTSLWPGVLMAQRWGCHPPVHLHPHTPAELGLHLGAGPHQLPPALQGQRNKGQGSFSSEWRTIPTAWQPFKEVVSAGRRLPQSLPVCVPAQIFIHFLRKTAKSNQPWEGWGLWKPMRGARAIFRNTFTLSFFSPLSRYEALLKVLLKSKAKAVYVVIW